MILHLNKGAEKEKANNVMNVRRPKVKRNNATYLMLSISSNAGIK
jgi:hypothetical protein